ncbi:MAG: ribosome assembly RNA-binding protein YhbY [Gammaproteobacteria bacterium]|nr:MAG: ribosome assembly RNA-binding protein YhbY [Gammaproteobacteria bacterium]
MAVNKVQQRYLKGLAHPLKPVVMIGNKGLTETVLAEIDKTLEQHELIKVRVSGLEKAERNAMIDEIALKSSANVIMSIGHIAAFYRAAKEPVIQLPKK